MNITFGCTSFVNLIFYYAIFILYFATLIVHLATFHVLSPPCKLHILPFIICMTFCDMNCPFGKMWIALYDMSNQFV